MRDREKTTLALDPRTSWNEQGFDEVTMCNDCKDELKTFYRECCVQKNSYHMHKNNNGNDETSPDRTKTDESGCSEQESDSFTYFTFNVIVPDDSLVNDEHVSESKKK